MTPGIRPWMFRSLIGKGHVEFSTKRQQDAQEFLLHVIEATERNAKNGHNPCSALQVLIVLTSSRSCCDVFAFCSVFSCFLFSKDACNREKSRSQSSTFCHIPEKPGFHFLMRKLSISSSQMWFQMKLIG